jgi:predicted alpha/beta-hydrolase family hydrolase
MAIPFEDVGGEPGVFGWLHEPAQSSGKAIVLTHGAGADCQSKLLVEMSDAFAAAGFTVLRFDLPFRRQRPHGPPFPGGAGRDRDGLRRGVAIMRGRKNRQVFLGGHSYGGRQASMLVAEEPELVNGLLLLSYPLHPPRKADELRTKHFPKLTTPAFFVHGTRDSFGSIAEMNAALGLIPGAHVLFEVKGAGHDLRSKGNDDELAGMVVREFGEFVGEK